MKILCGLFLCLSLVFTIFGQNSSPEQIFKPNAESEIETLVKEVSFDSQKGAIFNYSYLMKLSFQRHKFGGRRFTRLYEALLPSRFSLNRTYQHPLLLLEDSEKEISLDQIQFSRQSLAKEIERAENEEENLTDAEQSTEDGGYWTMSFTMPPQKVEIDVLRLLKDSRLSNLQRRQIDGADIILIDFAPNPNTQFGKSLSYLSKIEGQIWIDETTKRIIKIEGFPLGTFAEQKEKTDNVRRKEAVFFFQQKKVAEGIWFPQIVRLNFDQHPEIFEPIEIEFAFTDYKKWGTDVQYQNNLK